MYNFPKDDDANRVETRRRENVLIDMISSQMILTIGLLRGDDSMNFVRDFIEIVSDL